MKRSAGVTVAAVFSLLGSLLNLLLGFLMILMAIINKSTLAAGAPGGRAMMIVSSMFLTLPGIWGIATSVGLFRLKRWARISILIFASLLTFFGLITPLGLLAVRFPTPPNQDPAIFNSVRWGISVFYLCLAVVGVWWLVFFTRPSVKEQFVDAATTITPSRRPLSITVIACLLLLGSISLLFSALIRIPALFFNQILTGWMATLLYLAYAAVCLYLGIGLLRLNPRARIAAVAYSTFGVIAGICTYTLPGAQQRITSLTVTMPGMLHGENPTPIPTINPWFLCSVVLIVMGAQIYFLVTRKQAFYQDVAAERIQTSP